jgi:hypothetical protein
VAEDRYVRIQPVRDALRGRETEVLKDLVVLVDCRLGARRWRNGLEVVEW